MTRTFPILAVLGLLMPLVASADGHVLQLEYPGFTVWHDCALATFYAPGPDTGDIDRAHDFHLDPDLPEGCNQQTSTDT